MIKLIGKGEAGYLLSMVNKRYRDILLSSVKVIKNSEDAEVCGRDGDLLSIVLSSREYRDDAYAALCANNHVFQVRIMASSGVNLEYGFIKACESGSVDVVKLYCPWDQDYVNQGLWYACRYGQLEVVKLLGHRNVPDWVSTAAITGGYLDVLKHIAPYAERINSLLIYACDSNMDIVDYIVSLGADSFDECLLYSASKGNIPLTRYMLEHGATNYNQAIEYALSHNNMDVVDIITQHQEGIYRVDDV